MWFFLHLHNHTGHSDPKPNHHTPYWQRSQCHSGTARWSRSRSSGDSSTRASTSRRGSSTTRASTSCCGGRLSIRISARHRRSSFCYFAGRSIPPYMLITFQIPLTDPHYLQFSRRGRLCRVRKPRSRICTTIFLINVRLQDSLCLWAHVPVELNTIAIKLIGDVGSDIPVCINAIADTDAGVDFNEAVALAHTLGVSRSLIVACT